MTIPYRYPIDMVLIPLNQYQYLYQFLSLILFLLKRGVWGEKQNTQRQSQASLRGCSAKASGSVKQKTPSRCLSGDPVLIGYATAISALISEAKPVGKIVKGGK